MTELEKQVHKAHRRLGFQRFVRTLGWCWLAALVLAVVLIAIDKFYPIDAVYTWLTGAGSRLQARLAAAEEGAAAAPLGMSLPQWLGFLYASGVVVIALGVGLLAAAVWAFAARRGPLGAAIEIDRRFGLKERVASTLSMSPEDRQTEAGRALMKDTVRRVGRIDVASRFALMPGRRVLLPLLPGLLAVLLAFVPPMAENPAVAKAEALRAQEQVKESTKKLRERLAQRRKKARDQGLKDAERLFKKLEQGTRDLAGGKTERKKALATLNDLSRQLQQRRSELDPDKIKQQLNQLKNIARGPGDNFAKAIREGDFKKAAEELKAIQKQLAEGGLDAEQKKQLAQQLGQMQEKLQNLAQAQQTAQRDLQNRIGQLRQAGQLGEANKLQEQLDKLLQQAPQMQKLGELGEKLGQCAQCLREGQLQEATDALNQLQANLQQQLDEMEMLNDAMEQLRQARNQMNCPHCGGAGCQACQGLPQIGMGPGRGQGPRPEAEEDTDTYDSQVRQKPGKGAAVVTDLVDGPNVSGNTKEEIQQEFEAARRGDTEPLTDRNMPRKHRRHVTEYFDHFREGKK